MGLTLPILAKSFAIKLESASSVIGYLYGINTLGAATRAFLTIWYLLRWLGFEKTLRLGSALNAFSAVGAAIICMIKAHLKPGGLAVTWAPTVRVLRTFLQVFPHVLLVNGVAIGSAEAIETNPQTIAARLADPYTAAHYQRIGTDVGSLMNAVLTGRFYLYTPDFDRGPAIDVNSDLHPRDEFGVPQT